MVEPREILERSRRVAIVGASDDESKYSHEVASYLVAAGWDVVPVNPGSETVLGRTSYDTVTDVPGQIDVVEVFRPAEEAPEHARQAVAKGAGALWLQLDIRSEEARRIAEDGGLDYVQDHCMLIESERYGIRKN